MPDLPPDHVAPHGEDTALASTRAGGLAAHDEPRRRFEAWLTQATASEPNDPNAMTLATAGAGGAPSARMVLLKGVGPEGFVFYTNKDGRKGAELAANPQAALLFHWKSLRRQVRVEGRIEDVSEAEADEYYGSRARISRLGAWASAQSRPLADRAELEQRLAEAEARFPEEAVPRPPYWSGYRLVPQVLEFWQDMPYRLHDRTVYTREGSGWRVGKLYP